MPGIDCASDFSFSLLRERFASYCVTFVPASPYASRVASMFRSMNGPSLSGSDGLTWNCCTMPGQITPSRIEDSTSSASPTEGSNHVRRRMFAKNSTAQMMAMKVRMVFDGITAFLSVKPMPVNRPPPLLVRLNRSSQ